MSIFRNIAKISTVLAASASVTAVANGQDSFMQDFAERYLGKMPQALQDLAVESDQTSGNIADFTNVAFTAATPQVVEEMIEQEKCALAMTLADNMTDDIVTEASPSSVMGTPNFDEVLEDAILTINDRASKIQEICGFSKGP